MSAKLDHIVEANKMVASPDAMSADTAPAAMPGESLDELIDRARVAMAVYGDDGDFYGSEIIGDLIQALAEKERLGRENAELRDADRVHLSATRGMETRLTARALAAEAERDAALLASRHEADMCEQALADLKAAEAALAAERERAAGIADAEAGRQPNSQFYTHHELGYAEAARRIAAAIRAQGE